MENVFYLYLKLNKLFCQSVGMATILWKWYTIIKMVGNYLSKIQRHYFTPGLAFEKADFQKRTQIVYNQISGSILRKSGITERKLLRFKV